MTRLHVHLGHQRNRSQNASCTQLVFAPKKAIYTSPSLNNNGRGVGTSLICFGSWNWALSQIKLPARRRSCARAWPASVCQLLLICARALDQIRFSAPKGSMLLALPMASRARPCAVSGEDGSETFSASILQTEGDWLRMRC